MIEACVTAGSDVELVVRIMKLCMTFTIFVNISVAVRTVTKYRNLLYPQKKKNEIGTVVFHKVKLSEQIIQNVCIRN
jgi:hypothetical protein